MKTGKIEIETKGSEEVKYEFSITAKPCGTCGWQGGTQISSYIVPSDASVFFEVARKNSAYNQVNRKLRADHCQYNSQCTTDVVFEKPIST